MKINMLLSKCIKSQLILKICFLILFSFFIIQPSYTQHLGLKTLVGYRVAGNTTTPSGIIMPRESFNYQIVASYVLESGLLFDASYLRSPSHIKFRENPRINWQKLGELGVRHLMAGVGYQQPDTEAAVQPFGVFRVGGIQFNSLSADFGNFTKFAFAIEGGVKLPFNERLGLVTQINLMLPIHAGDGTIFPTNLDEYNFTPNPGIILPQFGLNTGLYFNF